MAVAARTSMPSMYKGRHAGYTCTWGVLQESGQACANESTCAFLPDGEVASEQGCGSFVLFGISVWMCRSGRSVEYAMDLRKKQVHW